MNEIAQPASPTPNCGVRFARRRSLARAAVDVSATTLANKEAAMSLRPPSEVRNVTGISDSEARRIRDFLQGQVYSRCNCLPDEWFSARDLFGGLGNDWTGTPMSVLYDKHVNQGKAPDQAMGRKRKREKGPGSITAIRNQ